MKKFLFQLLTLISLLLISLVIINILLPYHYGNPLYGKKLKYFNQNIEYNAVCFGSSRIYRQIKPKSFNRSFSGINLFNFGLPAAYNPESYFLFENFINELDSGRIEMAILEIQLLDTIPKSNQNTIRSSYYNNDLVYVLNYIYDPSFDKSKTNVATRQYLYSYFYELFNFSKIKAFKNVLHNSKINGEDGFYSLDHNLKETNSKILKERNLELKDSLTFKKRVSISAFSTSDFEGSKPNMAHINQLLSLIKIAQDKGIDLYLLIPPRLKSYKEVLAIENSIPEYVINLGSSKLYPEYYDRRMSFDINHLNLMGAELFSVRLAEKIKEYRIH